jgi:hypothetical protein
MIEIADIRRPQHEFERFFSQRARDEDRNLHQMERPRDPRREEDEDGGR